MVVAGLQESKWFWTKIYKVGKSVILSSGSGFVKERGEYTELYQCSYCDIRSCCEYLEGRRQPVEDMELYTGHGYIH